jgi:hypothetical protein
MLVEDLQKFQQIEQWEKENKAHYEKNKTFFKTHPLNVEEQNRYDKLTTYYNKLSGDLTTHYPAYQLGKTYHQGNLDLTNKKHQEGLSNFLRFSETKNLKACTQSKHALHVVDTIEKEITSKNNNKGKLAKFGDGAALLGGLFTPYTAAWSIGRLLAGDHYLDRPPEQLYHQTLDLIKQSSPLDRITELSSLCSGRSMLLPKEVQLRCTDEFRRTQNTLGKQLKNRPYVENLAKKSTPLDAKQTSVPTSLQSAAAQLQRDYLTAVGADTASLSSLETLGEMVKKVKNKGVLSACEKTLDDVRTRLAENKFVSPNEVNLTAFKNIVDELRTTATKTNEIPSACREPATLELISELADKSVRQQQAGQSFLNMASDAGVDNDLTTAMGNLGGHLGSASSAANKFTHLLAFDSPDVDAVDTHLKDIQENLAHAQQTMSRVEETAKTQTEETNTAQMSALATVIFNQTTTIATEGFEAQAHIGKLQGELEALKKKEPNNKLAILQKSVALQGAVDQAKATHDDTQQLLDNIRMGANLVSDLVAFVDPKVAKGLSVVANAGITIASSIVSLVSTGLAFVPIVAIAGAVVSFFSWLFSSGPDPMEVVMDYLQKLSQQLQAFQEHVDQRFDRLEDILLQLDSRTQRRFDRLENMLSDMYRGIIRAFGETQGKLDQLQETANKTLHKVKQILETLEQSFLNDRLNKLRFEREKALTYHQENPYSEEGQNMSPDTQRSYYGIALFNQIAGTSYSK